ncbi:hypothetical protein ABPG72_007740 [Tetrahymena utriculariae]
MGGCVGKTKGKEEQIQKQLPPLKRQEDDQYKFMSEYYDHVHKNSAYSINEEIMKLLQNSNYNQRDIEQTKQCIYDQYLEIYQEYPNKNQISQNDELMKKFCKNLDKQQGQNVIKVFMIMFEEGYLQKLVTDYQSLHTEFLKYLKEQNLQQSILDQVKAVITSQKGQDLDSVDQKQQQSLYNDFKPKLSKKIKNFSQQKEKMTLNKQHMVEKILIAKLSKSNDNDLQPLIQMTSCYLQGQSQFLNCINKLFKSEQNIYLTQNCPQIPYSQYQINEVNKFQTNPFPSQKPVSFSTLIGQFDNNYVYNNNKDAQKFNQQLNMKDKQTSLVLQENYVADLDQVENQQNKQKQHLNQNDATSSKLLDILSTKYTISNKQNDEITKNNFKQETGQKLQPNSSASQLINTLTNKYSMPNLQNNYQEKNEQKDETEKKTQQKSSSSQLINTLNNKYSMPHLHNDDLEKNEQKYQTQKNTQPNSSDSQLISALNDKYSMPHLQNNDLEKDEQKQQTQKNGQQNSSNSQLINTFTNKYSMNIYDQEKNEQKYETQKNTQKNSSSSQLINTLTNKYTMNNDDQEKNEQQAQKNIQQNSSSSQLINTLTNKYTMNNDDQEKNEQQAQKNIQQNSSSSQLINTLNNKYSMNNNDQEKNEQKYETQKNTQSNSSSSQLIVTLNNKYSMHHQQNGYQQNNEQKCETLKNGQQNSSSSQLIQTLNNKYIMAHQQDDGKENNEQKYEAQKNAQPNYTSSQLILNLNTQYGLIDNQTQINGKSNQNSQDKANNYPTFSTSQIVKDQENKYKLQSSNQDSGQKIQNYQTAKFITNEQNANQNNSNEIQEEKNLSKIIPSSVYQARSSLYAQYQDNCDNNNQYKLIAQKQTASQMLKEFNADFPSDQKNKNSSLLTKALDSNQQEQNSKNIVSFLGSVLNTEQS